MTVRFGNVAVPETDPSSSTKTTFCFLLFGFFKAFHAGLLLAATQDILGGHLMIPSTIVIIIISAPNLIMNSIVPFLLHRFSYLTWWLVTIAVNLIAMFLVIVSETLVDLRLIGVALSGLGVGLNMIVTMAMMARFPSIDELISANRTGIGLGDIISALIYTGLTTWTCVSPRTTIAASIPLCFTPLLVYGLLDKTSLKYETQILSRVDAKYQAIPGSNNNTSDEPKGHGTFNADDDSEFARKKGGEKSKMVYVVSMVWKVFPLAAMLYWSKMSRDVSLNSILTTIAFPSSPFIPRDHFQYYMLLFITARLAGGTGPLLVARTCPGLMDFFMIRRIWVLAFLDVTPIFIYFFDSWYRFIPNVFIVFAICLSHGFISGMMAVYATISTSDRFGDSTDRGVALGLVAAATPAGVLAAGAAGAIVEPLLKMHCRNELMLGEYCSTRFVYKRSWILNLHCYKPL